MSFSETLYIILAGTVSAVVAWIIISAIKYIHRKIKDLYSDVDKMKTDIDELKIKVKTFEEWMKING